MRVAGILAILLPALALSVKTDPFEVWNSEDQNCYSVKWIVSHAVLRHAVAYFGDHPREELKFEPNKVSPFTPTALFKAYYGKDVSAVKFADAILDLIPSHDMLLNEDRNVMRKNLYSYVNSGSYKYARNKASFLIKAVVNDFISDDEFSCAKSNSAFNVQKALQVEMAKLQNAVGDPLFGDLLELKVGTTLAFVIDDTGSMSGEIEAAKMRTREIVKLKQGSLDAPNEFVLVPFNDPSVGPVTRTRNADEFDLALSKVRAHGGGDAPEMCMQGIQLAIENSRPGSVIYVITDIQAKDVNLQDSVLAAAMAKNIQITFLLTNDLRGCGHANSIYKECKALYTHLAEKTGGKLLVFSKSDIFDATKIVEQSVQQAIVTVAKTKFQNSLDIKVLNWLSFPVSSLEQKLAIEATGKCHEHKLRRVDKNQTSTKMDVTRTFDDFHYFELNITSSRYGKKNFTIVLPPASTCDVTINALSGIDFILKLFKRKNAVDNFTLLESQPTADDQIKMVFDSVGLTDKIQPTKISFVSTSTGEVIESFPMTKRSTFGEPSFQLDLKDGVSKYGEFYVQVHGTVKSDTHNELAFVRTIPRNIFATSLLLSAEFSGLYFRHEVDARTNITIYNSGATDTFVVTTSDPLKLSSFHAGNSKKVVIESGGTAIVPIKFHTNSPLPAGKAVVVTISVTGTKSNAFQYASSYIVVGDKKRPRINSLSIEATINARFAETVIMSQMTNNADVAREAEIEIFLPRDAFLTELIMELEDETIIGKVEEKLKAEKIYRRAKKSGLAAGHVAARDDSTRAFRQSLLVEPRKNVTFILKYQQLMRKVLGEYEYAVVINPRQPVKHMTVTVRIIEDSLLGFVRVPAFQTEQSYAIEEDQMPSGVTITKGRHGKSATIVYKPTLDNQRQHSPLGLSGAFRVIYDVTKPMHGQVSVNNGYFVQFFSPPDIPIPPRLMVFVLDASGSMYGQKLNQLKTAMVEVLNSLNKGDRFNLVVFGDEPTPWISDALAWGNEGSLQDAKEFVQEINAFGGTNILSAVESAVEMLEPFIPELPESPTTEVGSGVQAFYDDEDDAVEEEEEEEEFKNKTVIMKPEFVKMESGLENYAKMVILLTDGKPSTGETDNNQVIEKITAMNQNRFHLHTVGFGSQADMTLMKKIAAKNGGESRRIFEGLHAGEQLKRYLTEVTSPVLQNISIDYPLNKVKDLTRKKFKVVNFGSELAVAGHINPLYSEPEFDDFGREQPKPVTAQISAVSFENKIEMDFDFDLNKEPDELTDTHGVKDFTKRMWAFMRLQGLLKNMDLLEDSDKKSLLEAKALNMSIEYSFVTPLTSIIALRDEDRKTIDDQLKKETTTAVLTTTTRRPYPLPYPGPVPDIDECIGEDCLSRPEIALLRPEEMLYYDAPPKVHSADFIVESESISYPAIMDLSKTHPALDMGYSDGYHPDYSEMIMECSGPGCVDYSEMDDEMDDDFLFVDVDECAGGRCDYLSPDLEIPTPTHSRLRKVLHDARGGGGGGFSGDPHFLIPLNDNVNICFNWGGFEGQVYNLIYDSVKMVAVNGMLKNVPSSEEKHSHNKTYVSQVAFIDLKTVTKCLVTPYSLTIVQRGAENMTIPLETSIHIQHGNIEILIDQVKKRSAVVTVIINKIIFQVTSYRDQVSSFVADHVDFGIINQLNDLDHSATGALGQFRRWRIKPSQFKVIRDNLESSSISIKNKIIKATHHEVTNPIDHSTAHCWYIKHAARSLTGTTKNAYLMKNMFDVTNLH